MLGEERKHANIPIAWMNRPIYILCVYSIDHLFSFMKLFGEILPLLFFARLAHIVENGPHTFTLLQILISMGMIPNQRETDHTRSHYYYSNTPKILVHGCFLI